MVSDDPDCHPTDVIEAPDGSLLVINTGGWFRIGCPTSQIAKPEIAGAIYRIRRDETDEVDEFLAGIEPEPGIDLPDADMIIGTTPHEVMRILQDVSDGTHRLQGVDEVIVMWEILQDSDPESLHRSCGDQCFDLNEQLRRDAGGIVSQLFPTTARRPHRPRSNGVG